MRKRGIWIVVAVMFTAVALVFALSIDKVNVTASEHALKDQGWYVSFSSPLKLGAVDQHLLFITDKNGKRTAATMLVRSDQKSLHVTGLEPGAYTLHVKKDAVGGKRFKSLSTEEIKFTIHETIESVSSAAELKAYFELAMATQKNVLLSGDGDIEKKEMAAEDSAGSEADYSTTNNQVEGVDEADSVKTDGDYIYSVLSNNQVDIVDIREPQKNVKASEINFEENFHASQLFLHEDTLIVLGEKYVTGKAMGKSSLGMDRMPMNGMTAVRLYDVSTPGKPTLIREIGTEGYLNGARKTGDMLYYVTNVRPYFEFAKELDEELLRPHTYDSEKGEEISILPYPDISILPGATEPTYSVITAIDLASDSESDVVTKGYLGGSEQLYMSEKNLYLTAMLYEASSSSDKAADSMIWNPGNANTEVFKFALDGTDVTFHSSAMLTGSLLNQFSMDEYKGNFRAVTTEGNMWDEKNPSTNNLFILDENLKQTGSVEGLAKGERIYSARFMGDKAYMVTFRETDPLFVIDVANPADPKVLGELKIPGFSNYLHPLDENHLIGFGYETVAEKNAEGGQPNILTMGMKISLFDVSDFHNPKEKDTEIIGGRGTYSQIQNDHKALFQHKTRNLYGFPVAIYEEGGQNEYIDFQGSGALIYEITSEDGIVLKGDLLKEKSAGQQYEEWETEVQRLLYSGDILYTLSMKELKSYSLDTFIRIGDLQLN